MTTTATTTTVDREEVIRQNIQQRRKVDELLAFLDTELAGLSPHGIELFWQAMQRRVFDRPVNGEQQPQQIQGGR